MDPLKKPSKSVLMGSQEEVLLANGFSGETLKISEVFLLISFRRNIWHMKLWNQDKFFPSGHQGKIWLTRGSSVESGQLCLLIDKVWHTRGFSKESGQFYS